METLKSAVVALVLFVASWFSTGASDGVPSDAPVPEYGSVTSVIDGDTIVVDIDGKEEFVRYIGIDTPEESHSGKVAQCYAKEASAANAALIEGREVTLVTDEDNRDKYNRLLRYVYVDDTFVNEELLKGGYARVLTVPPDTKYADEFKGLEAEARVANVGLWGACK